MLVAQRGAAMPIRVRYWAGRRGQQSLEQSLQTEDAHVHQGTAVRIMNSPVRSAAP